MSQLILYTKPPARRVSRARLRKWLEENGPQRIAKIRLYAKADVPDVKLAEVRAILEENPEFFSRVEDDVWEAVRQEKTTTIRVHRSRPRPTALVVRKQSRKSAAHPRATKRAEKKSAPAADVSPAKPISIKSGSIRSLLFQRGVAGGEPYESGRYLMLLLPQDGGASRTVLESTLQLARSTSECYVFEALPLGETIFRGTRRLLHAGIDERDARVRLIFDGADDDQARHRYLRIGNGIRPYRALSAGTPVALTTATPTDVAVVEQLSENLKKVVRLNPPAQSISVAECARQTHAQLHLLDTDSNKWPEYRDWLVGHKPLWSRRALEEALRMTFASADGIAPVHIARLAVMLLGNTPVESPKLAVRAAIASARTQDPEAVKWAKEFCLPLALEHEPENGELYTAAANIAIAEGRERDAARFFGKALDVGSKLDRDALSDLLLAVNPSEQRKLAQKALSTVRNEIIESGDPDTLVQNVEILQCAVDVAFRLGENTIELCCTVVSILLLKDEFAAFNQAAIFISPAYNFNADQKFRLLSLLEGCVSTELLARVADEVNELISRNFDRIKPAKLSAYISQLRLVETGAGWDHSWSDHYLASLPSTQQQPLSIVGKVLSNRRITIVGGRPISRFRARQALLELGALDVREIPPSFEERLDKKSVSQRVEGSDYVAMFTDYVKHDVQDILRELGTKIIFIDGGPSRLAAKLVQAAER